MSKATVLICVLSVFLGLLSAAHSAAERQRPFGFRLGSGILWAPEDKKDVDGERLYRQNYPFFAEFSYGRAVKGVLGVNHVFSQEAEKTEIDSLGEEFQFTPKLRQYLLHLGIMVDRPIVPQVRVYGGLGAGLVWRAYNPGWKDKSYWDKTRLGALMQAGVDVRLGPKAWIGAGWRSYAVGWRPEIRWLRGEYNRMRRMNVLSLTVSYYP